MLKVTYLFIVSSLLFVSSSSYGLDEVGKINLESELICHTEHFCSNENGELKSELNPTFAEGYEDGLAEGKRLALIPDYQTYQSIRRSYRDYSTYHPNYPQYFEHFRGKYLGIVDGWIANYVPPTSGGGLDLPGDVTCTDSNGIKRPCWLIPILHGL